MFSGVWYAVDINDYNLWVVVGITKKVSLDMQKNSKKINTIKVF